MNKFLSMKNVKILSFAMSMLFLMIHIAMYSLFTYYGVTPMARFNIFSMCFYCAMLILIHRGRLHIFTVATFVEICAHMGLAEYYTGWNGGFQLTLIGICVLLYFSEYVARSMHLSYTRSLILVPAAMLAYLVPLVIGLNRAAPYSLPDSVNAVLQIAWALIVFGVAIPILQLFVSIAARSQEELANEVLHDKLTGLPNRYYMSSFFRKMDSEDGESQYWIAMADLDDFKGVNDTYGHNCGDYVLVTLAGIIRELSPVIEVCRWGGEEFLLAGKGNTSDPKRQLERLCRAVEAYPFEYDGVKLRLTITVGAAWFTPGESIDDWIAAADRKLYEGKSAGKNRVVM